MENPVDRHRHLSNPVHSSPRYAPRAREKNQWPARSYTVGSGSDGRGKVAPKVEGGTICNCVSFCFHLCRQPGTFLDFSLCYIAACLRRVPESKSYLAHTFSPSSPPRRYVYTPSGCRFVRYGSRDCVEAQSKTTRPITSPSYRSHFYWRRR